MAVAWVFPGQGSHYVGMAGAWSSRSAAARDALAEAADALGFDLPALIAKGPIEDLSLTHNQQPAVLAASVAIMRAAGDLLPAPDFVAGHSLGEYTALVAAHSLEFADALRIVRRRGELMRLAGERRPGSMAAVLGLADAVVEDVCRSVGGVQIANYNCPGQVVISGAMESMASVVDELTSKGAKKIVPLAITIAAHSALMDSVAGEFAELVAAAPVSDARIPLIANVTAKPISGAAEIRSELSAQLTASVRWTESVRHLASSGVATWCEVGPGEVLGGLIKRIAREDGWHAVVRSVGEPSD